MKIAILSRTQKTANRGVESVVKELTLRLSKRLIVDVFSGSDADNLGKVLKGKYDIVMPINGRWQSLKFSLGRLIGKYKLVIGGHSGIGIDDIWNICVVRPDVFIALTDYMANWAKKWAWGSQVIKINNGVDLDKFNPQGEKYEIDLPNPIILSVGALVWYKHQELVIEAVATIENCSLLIVGDGEEKEKLTKLGNEKLAGRFKIIQISYSEMPKIYRAANVFTLPSWDREAFGLVYLEALASGLPVVAPNDLARKEIIGDGGVLVDITSPEAYSKAIQKALEIKWGDKPRQQAEKFSWDKQAEKYLELFASFKNEN